MKGTAMEIKWLGHACYKISHKGYSVVIDPYLCLDLGYPRLSVEADAVLVSHEHKGHNYREGVRLTGEGKECPFTVTRFQTYHDEKWGIMRGENTVHMLEWDGYKLVHMGDYACGLTDNDKFDLSHADVLMIACGGFRAMPAIYTKPLADELEANVVIPMHYAHDKCGNRRLERINAFTDQYMPYPIVKWYETNTITIDRDTPQQVAVLKYIP